MNTEYINILNSYEENSKQEKNYIHFRKAIENEEFSCFQQSGSERILNYLKQELGNDIPMLIDFSALPSSFGKNGKMADFMTIYDPFPKTFVDDLNKAYHTVYNNLGIKGENLGMFYKKDFFYEPPTSSYYFSDSTQEFPNNIIINKNNSSDEKKWLENSDGSIYFKNYSFELSYKQFEQNLSKPQENEKSCEDRNKILLGLYNDYFTKGKKGFLLSVPLIGFPSKNTDSGYEGLGAIFVYFITENKPAHDKIRKIANGLWFLGVQITYNSMFQIAYELAESTKKESIKSAIAALMARNMSHNLGSHPLTNTKNYFRKRIDEVISEDRYNCADVGADYRGNVHLLQYIKERMDFIATVVSGDQYPFGALNFKAQLFDVLTEDYHSARHDKRTQNFLLKYLVFSEKITRYDSNNPEDYKDLNLRILHKIKFDEDKNKDKYEEYTGKVCMMKDEESQKLFLSKLELAVPGGLMGRHAFFCIIENIIRNSAKHSKKDEDLEITIKLELNDDKRTMDISIYDNRESGEDVKKTIIDKHLKELVILKEENNHIDKNSKGLKEMLICALWLRNENVAEKLYEIQSEKDGEKKIELIKKYLDVSLVDKNGEKKENEGNLCYTIKNIPLFEICHQLEEGKDYEVVEGGIRLVEYKLVNLHADIVAADEDYVFLVKDEVKGERQLSDIFPRFVDLRRFNEKEREEWDKAYQAKNGEELFKMFDETNGTELLKNQPVISIESSKFEKENKNNYGIGVESCKIDESEWTILFKEHLDSQTDKEDKKKYVQKYKDKYLESTSGENFTSTIATFDFLQDFVNRYKVVEAANTHIAIIDERIYGDFQTRWNGDVGLEQELLEMRGIYLLNYENGKIINLQGGEFVKNENINFVSIHLGLLDKKDHESELIKEVDATNPEGKGQKSSINIKENILKKYFDEKTFVSIHSGRGNFSADLEDELKNYPFISLSALEAAFYDCKYFLTQLFKTTNYYGKGNITDK